MPLPYTLPYLWREKEDCLPPILPACLAPLPPYYLTLPYLFLPCLITTCGYSLDLLTCRLYLIIILLLMLHSLPPRTVCAQPCGLPSIRKGQGLVPCLALALACLAAFCLLFVQQGSSLPVPNSPGPSPFTCVCPQPCNSLVIITPYTGPLAPRTAFPLALPFLPLTYA